jgi:hypothetical protein
MLCSEHTAPPTTNNITSHKGGFYNVLGPDASADDPFPQPHSSATASKPPPVKSIHSGRTEMTIFLGLQITMQMQVQGTVPGKRRHR